MFTIVKKKDVPTTKGKTKTPFFVILCGSIDFLILSRAKVENRSCFLKNLRIHPEFMIPGNPKDAYTIPIQSLELQRMHII
jgi:hypothetical protein